MFEIEAWNKRYLQFTFNLSIYLFKIVYLSIYHYSFHIIVLLTFLFYLDV